MQNKIDLSKYFNKIYILTYLSSDYKTKIDKIEHQWNQLFSNDFHSSFIEIKYSFNSKLFKDLYSSYQEKNTFLKELDNHDLNITMWHYLIIKEAYEFGYEHILVLEDDITFLKNIEDIKNTLDNLPENYDICQLHKGYLNLNEDIYYNKDIKYNDFYYKFDANLFNSNNMIHVSSACNCYSRIGMQIFLNIFENLENVKTNITLLCDTYYVLLKDINYYIVYNDLCLCYVIKNKAIETDNRFTINKYEDKNYFYIN